MMGSKVKEILVRGKGASAPVLIAAAMVFALAHPALAETMLERVARNIETIVTGPIARSVAIIGLVVAGLSIIFGRNPGALLYVILGISIAIGGAHLLVSLTS